MNKEEFTRQYLETGSLGTVLHLAGVEDGGNDIDELYWWAKEIDKSFEKKPESIITRTWYIYDWMQDYMLDREPELDAAETLALTRMIHQFALTFLYDAVTED